MKYEEASLSLFNNSSVLYLLVRREKFQTLWHCWSQHHKLKICLSPLSPSSPIKGYWQRIVVRGRTAFFLLTNATIHGIVGVFFGCIKNVNKNNRAHRLYAKVIHVKKKKRWLCTRQVAWSWNVQRFPWPLECFQRQLHSQVFCGS